MKNVALHINSAVAYGFGIYHKHWYHILQSAVTNILPSCDEIKLTFVFWHSLVQWVALSLEM